METGSSELEKKEPAAAHMTNRKKKNPKPTDSGKTTQTLALKQGSVKPEDEVVR